MGINLGAMMNNINMGASNGNNVNALNLKKNDILNLAKKIQDLKGNIRSRMGCSKWWTRL